MHKFENEEVAVEVLANGVVKVQSKKTKAKATIYPQKFGLKVEGGGRNSMHECDDAVDRRGSLLVIDRDQM